MLDLHSVVVTGPTRLIEGGSPATASENKFSANVTVAAIGITPQIFFLRFLIRHFDVRLQEQVKKYVDIALEHHAEGHRFEDGIHLAIRAALCSTGFLYRGTTQGKLDDYDLAEADRLFFVGGSTRCD